ncbi:MAG TPA: hypothetical protein VK029_08720 [Pseudogracilibacillus sp.]|nr:hypothetical protein [Pseudogracilibacillus sp.]
MSTYMKHFAFIFLLLTGLSGIWLRLYSLFTDVHLLPYDHILHAHSHIAVLGWCFLATVLIYCHMIWDELERKKEAIALASTTFVVSILMFIAFLYEGYALYSIILSSVHIFVEYWAIIFIIKTMKGRSNVPHIVKLFMYGALASLFISSIGPWSLGVIGARGLKESPLFDMAIYFYLHFQYNGWLFFFLIGLFLFFIHQRGALRKEITFQLGFILTFIALFPAYVLSILWYDVGTVGIILAVIGAIGQLSGTLIIVVQLFVNLKQTTTHNSRPLQLLLLAVFGLLIAKSVMELGLLYVPFAQLIYETRAVVIGYLHLTFLGFITLAIFSLFLLTNMLPESKKVLSGLLIFVIGFLLNESTLFLSSFLQWIHVPNIVIENELLLIASIILTTGVCLLWNGVFTRQTENVSTTVTKKTYG